LSFPVPLSDIEMLIQFGLHLFENAESTACTLLFLRLQLGVVLADECLNLRGAGQDTDQKVLLAKLREAVPQLGLNADDEDELKTDVSTLELQLSSKNPKPSVVRECWISVRGILEKATWSLLAAGILHEISRLFSH
jgi:hypothetical protein